MKRLLVLVLVVLLAMTSMALAVDFTIDKVEVNDVENPTKVVVERGETLNVEAWISATVDTDDISVYAWIRGEDGKIETETASITYLYKDQQTKVSLALELPEDLEAKTYALHIEAENADGDTAWGTNIDLEVKAVKHKMEVKKVINLPTSVKAGETIEPIVLVENIGAKEEEDVDLSVSICDADMNCIASSGDFLGDVKADETVESRDEMKLKVPTDAKTGNYNIVVEVTSDDTSVVKKFPLQIKGVAALGEVEAIISLDTTTKQVAQNGEVAYKITFANLGDEKVVYSVSVVGTEGWATVRTEPGFVSVEPTKAAELVAYLKANENAPIGSHAFTLKVGANGETVKEIALNAEVTADESYNWESIKKGLEIGFAVLVVILIILGLVVAFRRGKTKEADTTEEAYY